MPKNFKDAIKQGARVRTKKLSGGRYVHQAFLDGRTYSGEVHKKKTNPAGTTRKKS